MNIRSLALALLALCLSAHGAPKLPFAGGEPPGKFSDMPIDISAERLDASGALTTASGNVQMTYGATTIFADEAQYSPVTRDVIALGNVRIYRDGQLVTAERAVYNLETKDITSASVNGDNFPYFFSGNSFQNNAGGGTGYLIKGGVFTTSDSLQPDWSLRARRIRMYPNDSVILYDVDLCIGETTVMRLPYLYQSLNRENSFSIVPGYRSVWGGYLLTNYTFPLTDKIGATLRLDYLSKRGVAVGLNTHWAPKENGGKNWGRFTSYGLHDSNPDTNKTALTREAISSERYRVSLQARQYLTEDIYASVNINKLSDTRFLQDFNESEFIRNPHPDNVVSLTKFADDYTVTLLARKQLNEFFDSTERSELALDMTRQPVLGSKAFYEGQTSGGVYRRNFAKGSALPDYGYTRVDSFHQFLFPHTYLGWLSVVPRIGVRGTWYSESGGTQAFAPVTPLELSSATAKNADGTINRLLKTGSVFRPVFNAGVEASFKASRAYEDVQSRAWGLDGMRHIVQPYINLSYVTTDSDGKQLFQIDRLQRSSQLPGVDFPTFNSIDAITSWNIARIGMRNRLQTRRDDSTFNWFEMDSYMDLRFQNPNFGSLDPDPGRYSNFVNRIRWNPVPWVTLAVDSQLPLLDSGFTEVNTDLYFMPSDRVSFNVGHRYLSGNVLFQDSSLLNVGAHYRINDNWAVSAAGQYEFRDHTFESQTYEIHRDLTSWIASIGFTARNNGTASKSQNDYGVTLSFTLKDLPGVRLPVSVNPGLGGNTASSSSR